MCVCVWGGGGQCYINIIQVENKNVGLKVGGGAQTYHCPQSKKRGHMPPLPPSPLPTPVIIISYLVCETQVSRFPSTQENRSTHTCGTYLHKTNTIINTDHAKGTILIHKMCKKNNPKTPNNNNKQTTLKNKNKKQNKNQQQNP